MWASADTVIRNLKIDQYAFGNDPSNTCDKDMKQRHDILKFKLYNSLGITNA